MADYTSDLYHKLESVQIHIEWLSRDVSDQELIVNRETQTLQDKYIELNGLISEFNEIQMLIRKDEDRELPDDRQE